ncbi:MAG: D-alanine-D-alanine ligase [Acidobacteriota bacterium]|nr:D-alanine-D-alanine ligase [Acidobacteriota bacterium]
MRIGLTYNLKPEDAPDDAFEEFDSLETIEGLERAIRAAGHEPVRLGWGASLLDDLPNVDGVFNIAEGIGGRGRESQAPALCEMLGVPCSGSGPLAIGLTLDKALAKTVAKAHGIATAPWTLLSSRASARDPGGRGTESAPPPPGSLATLGMTFPLFAKPANEGSSMGITERSLCHNEAELNETVNTLTKYGPVLVEEFLPGDEFTVGIVDGEVLAVMQVVPRETTEHFIYSLEVKRDYTNRVDYKLVDAPDVAEVALAVWRAFELRDVARVDVRRDRDGVANFVEVNPLPGVHPINSDLVIMAKAAGSTHEQLIARIVASAERRWRG